MPFKSLGLQVLVDDQMRLQLPQHGLLISHIIILLQYLVLHAL